jgi:O-antigen ligase
MAWAGFSRRGGGDPLRLLADVLLFLGLAYAIIGVDPFNDGFGGDLSQGNPVARVAPLALFALAVPLIVARWTMTRELLARNWMLVLTLAWIVLSIAWSDHRGLSLRRVGFLVIGYFTAVGVAVWADDIGRTIRVTGILLAGVILIDLLSVPLIPHLSMSDEGAKGMHLQKNQAGAICMMAFVVFTLWLPQARRLMGLATILGLILMTVIFMVLTKSKTSMGLVGLYLVFFLPLAAGLAWERGRGVVLILFAGIAISAFVFLIGVQGWTLPDVLEVLFGDPTFTGRTDIWDFAQDKISQRPLLGTGYGAFWDVGAENDPLRHANNWLRYAAEGIINQTHNGYIDLWVQAGFPAMLGGVVVMVRPLILAGRGLARDSWDTERWTGYAQIFCMMALFLVYNLMESAILSRVHFFSFIILLYILFAERWSMPDIALSRRAPIPRGWGR